MLIDVIVCHEPRLVGRQRSPFPKPTSRRCVSAVSMDSRHVPTVRLTHACNNNLNLTVVINPENAGELLVIDESRNRIYTVNMDTWYAPEHRPDDTPMHLGEWTGITTDKNSNSQPPRLPTRAPARHECPPPFHISLYLPLTRTFEIYPAELHLDALPGRSLVGAQSNGVEGFAFDTRNLVYYIGLEIGGVVG